MNCWFRNAIKTGRAEHERKRETEKKEEIFVAWWWLITMVFSFIFDNIMGNKINWIITIWCARLRQILYVFFSLSRSCSLFFSFFQYEIRSGKIFPQMKEKQRTLTFHLWLLWVCVIIRGQKMKNVRFLLLLLLCLVLHVSSAKPTSNGQFFLYLCTLCVLTAHPRLWSVLRLCSAYHIATAAQITKCNLGVCVFTVSAASSAASVPLHLKFIYFCWQDVRHHFPLYLRSLHSFWTSYNHRAPHTAQINAHMQW